MAIFVVINDAANPQLANKIAEVFPGDFLNLGGGHLLIKADTTSQGVCERLGVVKGGPFPGTIVFSTSGYFGLHNSSTWEWLKTKSEA